MSPIEAHKLTPVSPLVPAGREAKVPVERTAVSPLSRPTASPALNGVAVELRSSVDAGKPPVDHERVQEIQTAIKSGRYPVVPAQIADAMIAARLILGMGK